MSNVFERDTTMEKLLVLPLSTLVHDLTEYESSQDPLYMFQKLIDDQ